MADVPRFKLDENMPLEVAEHLQRAGYDATTVWEERLSGSPDTVIATICQNEQRALLTLDVGFANVLTYPPAQYPGIIVLRLKRQERSRVLETIARLVALLSREPLQGRLWIVEEERVRIRG